MLNPASGISERGALPLRMVEMGCGVGRCGLALHAAATCKKVALATDTRARATLEIGF